MVGKAGCVIRKINTLLKRKATGLRVKIEGIKVA
ncbi:hypothetical protein SRABI84_03188 [Peribacillus simplex]|nr:hypothetical protein SRABI84_03188 [Peribacillus simplex]